MNNGLDYQTYYSVKHPGLWILLTDEEEESINQINRFINECIQGNFNGKEPLDRCYIHVIGINGVVHRLTSGYLSDLEAKPLEIIRPTQIRICEDPKVGISQIPLHKPIWCKKCEIRKEKKLLETLKSIIVFLKEWMLGNPDSPVPVVWYVSSELIENFKVSSEIENAINDIKAIQCKDGKVLYCNVFSSMKADVFLDEENDIVQMSSFIPSSYVYNFRYMAKHNLEIDHKIIGENTHMSFNISFMDRLIVPIMGWLSEPKPDMDLVVK